MKAFVINTIIREKIFTIKHLKYKKSICLEINYGILIDKIKSFKKQKE